MVLDLISRLRSLGMELRVDGDRLVCDSPEGALDDALKAEIRANKGDLRTFLAAEEAMSPDGPPIPRLSREGELPLGFVQQRMWVLQKMEPETTVYNLPGAWRFSGHLEVDAFQRAFRLVIDRHEILRARFAFANDVPTQTFDAPLPDDPLPIVDISAVPAGDREAALARHLEEERTRSFDLEAGPVWVAKLFRLGDSEHVFFFMPHHIIWDGWSFDILLDDLAASYDAFRAGREPEMPALPVQYADYAAWHRSLMSGPEMERQLAYWREALGGPLPVLRLPSGRPRPAVLTDRGDRILFRIGRDTIDGLTALGRAEDATLFMTVLAIYNVLLLHFTAQEDVTVGAPIQNRLRPEAERLLGVFVNTLVLRLRCAPEMSFRELLRQTREVCLGAFDNQDVPFERLVEELSPERTLSHTPLFQTLFTFQNIAARPRTFGDTVVSQVHVDVQVAPTDLLLGFMVGSSGALLVLDFAMDVLDRATVDRMRAHLVMLLETAASEGTRCLDQPISAMPALTPAEQEAISSWNATGAPIPDVTVHELVSRQVARTPDRVAVADGATELTYGELDALARAVADRLVASGVRPGDLVGVAVERSPEMVAALLGVLMTGAAYVPLDPDFPDNRLKFMIQDAGLDLVVTDRASSGDFRDRDVRTLAIEDVAPASAAVALPEVDPANAAYVIYTSGSTGRPKGVQVTHRNVVNFLSSMQDRPGCGPDDVVVAVTTLSFDIAVLELLLPLVTGARVVVADRDTTLDGVRLGELLDGAGATIMQATPATWRMLLESGWRGRTTIRALCGGEALAPDLARQLVPLVGELWNMYGPTETTVWSTCARIADPLEPITIGSPISNTVIRVADRLGRQLPCGVTGELWIGGEGVARGYLDRPELTAERFVEAPDGMRFYRTGDLARYRTDGTLDCLGRIDNQVKVQGYRVELGEIESRLTAQPEVSEAVGAVVGAGAGDARLVAYVVYHPGDALTATEVRRRLRDDLPAYMIPSLVLELQEIPRTLNGKVDRQSLPDPLGASTTAVAFEPPETPAEVLMAEVWQHLLPVDQVGKQDNFFELGGHSLLSMRVVAAIETRTGYRLDPRLMFFNTMETLAAELQPHIGATSTVDLGGLR